MDHLEKVAISFRIPLGKGVQWPSPSKYYKNPQAAEAWGRQGMCPPKIFNERGVPTPQNSEEEKKLERKANERKIKKK